MSRGRGFSGVSVFAVLQCVQKKQRRAALQIEGGILSQGQVVALINYMSQILVELIKLAIPVGLPLAASMYFDVFDGIIQTVVFVFLTAMFTQETME